MTTKRGSSDESSFSKLGAGATKTCFIIAPIGEESSDTRKRADQVLDHIIAPIALNHGYQAIRADQIAEPGIITSQVVQHIVEDPLVVADLTDWNPNVFYELAIRQVIRKPLNPLLSLLPLSEHTSPPSSCSLPPASQSTRLAPNACSNSPTTSHTAAPLHGVESLLFRSRPEHGGRSQVIVIHRERRRIAAGESLRSWEKR